MIKPLVVALLSAVAPIAFAQAYIVPEGECGAVTFHIQRHGGETLAADSVKQATVYLPGKRVSVTPAAAAHSLDFTTDVPNTNVVAASVDLAPVVSGNETRTDHAKAFVRCGAINLGDDWQRTTNLGVEIYPQWNGILTKMKPGDSMRFIVVDKATKTLLRDVPMELARANGEHLADGTPASGGGMNFPYSGPGRYIVKTTWRRADPEQPNHWLVDTSTLTFEIK